MHSSCSLSRLDVASSSSRIEGAANSAHDRHTLPPAAGESPPALADDRVASLGHVANEFVTVRKLRRRTSSTEASGRENRMLSAIVPSKRNVSCDTRPKRHVAQDGDALAVREADLLELHRPMQS
jgi:hypothetical protein